MPRGFAPSKKDTTQPLIEAAFIAAGWGVCDVHAVGKNAPDIFVSALSKYLGCVTIAIEVKSPGGKRKAHQVSWADNWHGHYLTGSDPQELLRSAEAIRDRKPLYIDRSGK